MKRILLMALSLVIIWSVLVNRIVSEYYVKQGFSARNPQIRAEMFARACQWNPLSSLCKIQLAIAQDTIGLTSHAYTTLSSLIVDQDGDVTQWAIYYLAGVLSMKLGMEENAVDLWKTGLLYWPKNPELKGALSKTKWRP